MNRYIYYTGINKYKCRFQGTGHVFIFSIAYETFIVEVNKKC